MGRRPGRVVVSELCVRPEHLDGALDRLLQTGLPCGLFAVWVSPGYFPEQLAADLNEWWDSLPDHYWTDLGHRSVADGSREWQVASLPPTWTYPAYLDDATGAFRGYAMARTMTIASFAGAVLTIDLHPYPVFPPKLADFLQWRCYVKVVHQWTRVVPLLARQFGSGQYGQGLMDMGQFTAEWLSTCVSPAWSLDEIGRTLLDQSDAYQTFLQWLDRATCTPQSLLPLACDSEVVDIMIRSGYVCMWLLDLAVINFTPGDLQLGGTVDPVMATLSRLFQTHWKANSERFSQYLPPAKRATGSGSPSLGTQPPAAVGSPDPIPLVSPTTGFWDTPAPPVSTANETRPKTLDFAYPPAPSAMKEPELPQQPRQPPPVPYATRRPRQPRREPRGTIFGRYLWGFQPPVPETRLLNGRPSHLLNMVPAWTQLEDDRTTILTQFRRFLKSYAGPMDPLSSESIRQDFLLAVLYAQFPVIADHPALWAYEVPPEGTQTVAKLGLAAIAPDSSAQASWYDQQTYLLTRANPAFKIDETPSTLLDVFHEGKTPTGIFQSTLLGAKLYFQAYAAGLNHPADAPRRYVTPVMDRSAGDRAREAAAKAKAAPSQPTAPAATAQSAPPSPQPKVVKGRGRGRGYGRQVSTSTLPGGVKVAFTEASASRPDTSVQPDPSIALPPAPVPTAAEVLQAQLEQRAQAIAEVHRRNEVEQQLVLRTESIRPDGAFGTRLRSRTASPNPLSSLWERLSHRFLELPGATSTTYQVHLPDGSAQQTEQLQFSQTYQLRTSELILDEYILTRRRSMIPTLRELSPLRLEHPAIDMYSMSPRALGTLSPVDNPFRVDRSIQLGGGTPVEIIPFEPLRPAPQSKGSPPS